MEDVVRIFPCLVFGFLIIFLSACGKRPAPTSATAADSAPGAKASQAVFEERDETGAVAWRLKAESVMEESGVIIGQGLVLENRPSGADHPDYVARRGALPTGASRNSIVADAFSAVASRGAIWRESSASVVRLEDGFSMKMESGWNVEGGSVTWNGKIMKARDSVVVSRPGTLVHGQNAMIDPKKNRFILRKVSGVISEMSL